MNINSPVPVGVFGASGYVGQELLRLLAGHPGASLVFATAESAAGERVEGLRLVRADDAPLDRAEVVLSALPHGISGRYVQEARAVGKRAVDLSADFRLSPDAVYGLTEVARPRVARAELLANPGCYPTAALLALIPLAQRGLIDESREVVIDAASGVTGAGRNPTRELLFGEVAEDFRAYAVGNEHRHLPELRATLARESGFAGDLVFTPHLLPVKRGILETIHVPLSRVLDQATAEGIYETVYADEPCVRAVSTLSRRLALPVEKQDGLRVTTPAVAEAVEMVLAGPANRLVVAALRAAGLDAIGLSGVDGGLLTARPAPGGLGHVGEIAGVRASLLESLLLAGLTPVIAPMAPGPEGGLPLNVNADEAAAAVAAAVHAAELLFLSDVPGVQVDGAVQPALDAGDVETLIELGAATDGMTVKLRAAVAALRAGARAARIGDVHMLGHPSAGTRVLAAAAQPA